MGRGLHETLPASRFWSEPKRRRSDSSKRRQKRRKAWPLGNMALELGVRTYADLCSRMEKGEKIDREAFVRALQAMFDVLLSTSDFRWQRTRSSVDDLLHMMDLDECETGGDIENVQEKLLRGREALQDAFQDETPLGVSARRALVREAAQATALRYKAVDGSLRTRGGHGGPSGGTEEGSAITGKAAHPLRVEGRPFREEDLGASGAGGLDETGSGEGLLPSGQEPVGHAERLKKPAPACTPSLLPEAPHVRSPRTIDAFPLESPQDRLLSSALAMLERAGLKRDSLVLSGGSVLASRWGHRPPGGIVLLCEQWDWRDTFARAGEEPGLKSLLAGAGGTGAEFGWDWMSWRTPDGAAGVFTEESPALADQDLLIETRHGIRIERTARIIRQKIRGRMLALGELSPLDALDLLAAEREEPEELAAAIERIAPGDIRTLVGELDLLERLPEAAGGPGPELWRKTARLLMGLHLRDPGKPLPDGRAPPHGTSQGLPPDPIKTLPPEEFEHPLLAEREGIEPSRFGLTMRKNMAGHPLNPGPDDVSRWIRESEDLSADKAGYLRNWLGSLIGIEAATVRQACGVSVLDMARMADKACRRFVSGMFASWLNRYALRIRGEWRGREDGYRFLNFHKTSL